MYIHMIETHAPHSVSIHFLLILHFFPSLLVPFFVRIDNVLVIEANHDFRINVYMHYYDEK